MKKVKISQFYNNFHKKKEHKVVDFMTQNRYEFLRSLLKNQTGKVLVVGCGSRDEMSILNDKCEGTGLDISKVAVEKSKKNYPRFRYIVGDAQNMPFGQERFDCIVCSEVIEHLPDDEKFLEEAYRVLKPQGRLIITAPNWISWYGLARKLGEALLRRPLTSGDQPIDHWYTYWSLKRKTDQYFTMIDKWGLWFFPPFGKGKWMIPELIAYPLVRLLNPLNTLLRGIFPIFGHCLAFELTKQG
jgi:ubiquinone/menaquinone biosynthesis C-methylase UbiE